jgi:hypothetical protein
LDDDRGFINLCVTLIHDALNPPPPLHREMEKKPGWLERLDRWVARGRQREVERYLASSNDVFELESRMKALERRPYY